MSKILVIDDDRDTLSIASSILAMQGFDVIILSDGDDIISRVEEAKPDLILLDINMGASDGRQVCLELKTMHGYKNRILLFSADADDSLAWTEYKADGIIRKPVDMHSFILTVREHLPYV